MDKNLLVLTFTDQFIAACINHSGIDSINDDIITKCKDLATKIVTDSGM